MCSLWTVFQSWALPIVGLAPQLVDHRAADAGRGIVGKGIAAILIMATRLDQFDQPGLDQIVQFAGARDARKHLPGDLADQRRMIRDQHLDALAIAVRAGGGRSGMWGGDRGAELLGSLSSHAALPSSGRRRRWSEIGRATCRARGCPNV